MGGSGSKEAPLQAMTTHVKGGANSLMGYWYVASCVPTFIEKGAHNSLEFYEWTDKAAQKLRVTFKYKSSAKQKKPSVMYQDGRVINQETGAEWVVRPRLFNGKLPLPVWLPFIVLEANLVADPTKAYMVIGQPDRSYLWIMFRDPHFDTLTYSSVENRCVEEWGYDRDKIKMVPQSWDDDYVRSDPSVWMADTADTADMADMADTGAKKVEEEEKE